MSDYPAGSLDDWLQRNLPEMVKSIRLNAAKWAPVHHMPDEHVQGIIVALARSGWMTTRAPRQRCKHCGEEICFIGRADLKPLDRQQWCHVNAKGEYTAFDCCPTYATPEDPK
jgi:hypothetical protein